MAQQRGFVEDTIRAIVCFKAPTSTLSNGIWAGDHLTEFSLTLLLAQVSLLFAATHFTHFLLRPLGQPQVVSYVIAGMIFGTSGLSRNESVLRKVFPPRSWVYLNCLSLLCYILYIFVVSVKTDLRFPRKSRRKAIAISQVSTILPFFLANFVIDFFQPTHTNRDAAFFINNVSARWAVTSNIVLSCLLSELDLLTSKLGRLAMTACLFADLECAIFKAALSAFSATLPVINFKLVMYSVLALAGLVAFILLIARPIVIWMIKRTPEGEAMDEGHLVAVLLMAVVCGLAGEVIGQHVTMGTFFLGLVLPGGPPLGTTLVDRVEKLTAGVFLPVYVAIAGLSTDVGLLGRNPSMGLFTVLVIAVSVAAKFAGVIGTGMYFGMEAKDALVVALMLNCRGIVELYSFRSWQESWIVDGQMYGIQIMALVVVSGVTAPILKHLYDPSRHFMDPHKRRSIGHSAPSDELRILACANDEHNAGPLFSLLQTSLPSPTCVYLLHLTPLAGKTSSVLAPYNCKKRRWAPRPSVTDHIVNVFRYLEHSHRGCITVHPFIAVSPYASVHDDICQLAFDKKIALVLLPFHRRHSPDSADASIFAVNPAVRAMNINVLHYAPCTVAIFLDHGGGPAGLGLLRSVAVYFLGGVDDREALAYAMRMAENPSVGLTVIRPVLPAKLREGVREEKMDERAVEEFRAATAGNKRVEYREEEVKDGVEMTELVKATCGEYSLVIVGRREGERSSLTEGLEIWSEYPELGVVGDVLASADLGGKVSTLVVQQKPSDTGLRGGGGGGVGGGGQF